MQPSSKSNYDGSPFPAFDRDHADRGIGPAADRSSYVRPVVANSHPISQPSASDLFREQASSQHIALAGRF